MFSRADNSIPYIWNYKEAKHHYESVKPVRGSDIRPIGARRNKHKQIVAVHNGYAARLYDTNVITWLQSGEIILDSGGYVTNTTSIFINDVVPGIRCSVHDKYLMVQTSEVAAYQVGTGEDCLVLLNGEVVQARPFTVHKANRTVLNEYRKKYAGFITYVNTMAKIMPEYNSELRPPHLIHGARCDVKMLTLYSMQTNDMDEWAETLPVLVSSTSSYKWVDGGYKWCKNLKAIQKFLDDTIKSSHANEIFTEVSLPLGVYKKDTNAKYM